VTYAVCNYAVKCALVELDVSQDAFYDNTDSTVFSSILAKYNLFMPRASSDKLVLLIKSLTKAEKRSFRIFVNRNPSAGDSLFMQLFDLILKSKSYEDTMAIQKIDGLKKSQLSNLKANLYKQLLSCLRLIESKKIDGIQVREQIDFAKILYEKGLYKPCLELLDKAKKQALHINYETLALSILYFEKRIESQHVTGSMSAKADELTQQSNELLEEIALTNQLSNASLLLYGRYLRHGYVKNRAEYQDLKNFITELLPEVDVRSLEFYQKLYLFQSYVWFYNMGQNFANYYKYSRKWVDLYDEYPTRKVTVTTPFIKGYHNLLNALFMMGKRTRFNKEYRKLLLFDIYQKPHPTQNEISLYYLFRWTHFLNKIFLNAEYKVTRELEELEKILSTNEYGWDLNRILVMHYKIGSAYFGIGDLDKTREHLNKITNNNYPEFREDIQSFARMLNLIANFDTGNEDLVSYQVKSLYRYLSNLKELGEVQLEVIKFLRSTPKIAAADINDAFKKLRDKLLSIETKEFEKRPFLYLDIISWLESKIEDKAIRVIIKDKLNPK
jgi:hypothetical protein